MLKRARTTITPPIYAEGEDYWTRLMHQLVLSAFREVEETPATEENIELPRDPGFLDFLKIASQYGAPASLDEFTKLNPTDRAYYLKAYEIYLRNKLKEKVS